MAHQLYAHSAPEGEAWEPLEEHVDAVAETAARLAEIFGWGAAAKIAGALHDLGKRSPEFQAYLRGERKKGGDHSTAGATLVATTYPHSLSTILSAIIAGHHGGLANGGDLAERLKQAAPLPPDWKIPLPPQKALQPTQPWQIPRPPNGFSQHVLIRMLFSSLVDADFLETERFYDGPRDTIGEDLTTLRDRLASHMVAMQARAKDTTVNRLRADVLTHAIDKATSTPGLFTLTVPTGGGKTLASLSFALEHAVRNGMRRVIYVIPYTSIIEQTAAIFANILGQQNVLEHHASFDWDDALRRNAVEDENAVHLAALHKATENWDAPVVVTTAVQFFESLFANRTSRCRKLHNIAGSVVVLDEAQTLPLQFLQPCLAMLAELSRNYRSSIVLCTATQPAISSAQGFTGGLDIVADHELAPEPQRLYTALKRTSIDFVGVKTDAEIADRFAAADQMLCIVNRRNHAQDLYKAIQDLPGAVHLTTLMCPRHRRAVLADVRQHLTDEKPVRVVSTSLIEAGVDVDFPEVWRAAAGLESIAQAAGRCNREGRRATGPVRVFEPAEAAAPHELEQRWQATKPLFERFADVQSLEAVEAYFKAFYWQKGPDATDAAKIGSVTGILKSIQEHKADLLFPFADIAAAFKIIDDWTMPVIVPWRATPEDTAAQDLLSAIKAMDKPARGHLRRLQQYSVAVPPDVFRDWLARGVLTPVHPALGETMMALADDSLYDPHMGIVLDATLLRAAETNIIG